MDLIERFRYLMKLNQLTASAFADEIGVQRSSVSHILSGRNKPSLEFIQKVIQRFPKVDAGWLISGVSGVQTEDNSKVEPKVAMANEQIQPMRESKSAVDNKELKLNASSTEEVMGKPRKVKQVVVFYTDETYEEFVSLNQKE